MKVQAVSVYPYLPSKVNQNTQRFGLLNLIGDPNARLYSTIADTFENTRDGFASRNIQLIVSGINEIGRLAKIMDGQMGLWEHLRTDPNYITASAMLHQTLGFIGIKEKRIEHETAAWAIRDKIVQPTDPILRLIDNLKERWNASHRYNPLKRAPKELLDAVSQFLNLLTWIMVDDNHVGRHWVEQLPVYKTRGGTQPLPPLERRG